MAIAGPAGKLTQVLKTRYATNLARAIVDPGGLICSWIASTKAMVQVSHKVSGKLFVAVDDLARAVGVPWSGVGGITLSDMALKLRSIGAVVSPVVNIRTMSDAVSMLGRDGSVLMISLRAMKKGKEVGGHAVYAFRDFIGKVRIMDRTGIYGDMNGMTGAYCVDDFIPRAAAHVQNVYAKMMSAGKAAVLAVGALGVVASERR